MGDVPLPLNAILVPPSGDGTGAMDNAAIRSIVELDGGIAVLESAADYFDDGTPMSFAPGARVITTDRRPAFWKKGYLATDYMNALPGCICTSYATITMLLPEAEHWPEQVVVCEPTAAVVVTVQPAVDETIGVADAVEVGGAGDRATIHSRGMPRLLLLSGGPPEAPKVWTASVFSPEETLYFAPGPLASGLDGELGNYEFYFGRLRAATGFANGSAILFRDVVSGAVLVDYQAVGDTSPANYRYMRETFFTGYRVQMRSNEPSRGYSVSALGANIPILFELGNTSNDFRVAAAAVGMYAIEVSGNGAVRVRAHANQSVRLMSGSQARVETNATGIGFNGAPPVPPRVITGSRSNPAEVMAQLLEFLAARGDIIDETTD